MFNAHANIPSFQYCPQCKEALKKVKLPEGVQSCDECGWKYYFPTPQTAAAIVMNDKNEVLLVKRKNEPFKGKWSLPAGFVMYGELPIKAAIRELREETHLEAEYDRTVGVYFSDDHPQTFSVLTVIITKKSNGIPEAMDDADAFGYFSLSNLPEIAFKAQIEALRSLQS